MRTEPRRQSHLPQGVREMGVPAAPLLASRPLPQPLNDLAGCGGAERLDIELRTLSIKCHQGKDDTKTVAPPPFMWYIFVCLCYPS
jgi:hypothetical protein